MGYFDKGREWDAEPKKRGLTMHTKLYTKPENAVAAGYAEFNRNPTLAVDVPDGGFTITAKTTEGKRITFAFQPYKNGGPPQCVDIQYHDADFPLGRNGAPRFDALLFGEKDYDTRKHTKPGIVCVLMDNKKETA